MCDIVAEAGSSNKAFHRYFAGKDELILAVMERGVGIVVSYLEHQMAKEAAPTDKIVRWIEGTLAQVAAPIWSAKAAPRPVRCRPYANWRTVDQEMMRPLRDLLVEPVAALGSNDVDRNVEAVFCCTAAPMRRYLGSAAQSEDISHVVQFCLNGLGVT